MLVLFDDDIKESVKAEMQFQPILNTFFSKVFGAAWPRPPLEGLKKLSRRCAARKKFLKSISLPNNES